MNKSIIMKKLAIALSVAAVLLAPSCAKDVVEGENASSERVLDSWIRVNYPDVKQDTSGVFILHHHKGTGRGTSDSCYVFAHYVRTDLYNVVAATNMEYILRRTGSVTKTTYLGSAIWQIDQGAIPAGLESVIKRMHVGDTAVVALPAAKSKVANVMYSAFNASETDNVIYTVAIDTIVNDINAYQDELLKDFARKHYGDIQPTRDGLYLHYVGRRPAADTIADEEVVGVKYMAYRLDGTLFDTNIRDTAKRGGIYSASSPYDTLTFTYYRDSVRMFSNNTSYITGFTFAVNHMRHHDTVDVFFRSNYGYGAAGNGAAIPGYCPLLFKIYIQEDPKDAGDE